MSRTPAALILATLTLGGLVACGDRASEARTACDARVARSADAYRQLDEALGQALASEHLCLEDPVALSQGLSRAITALEPLAEAHATTPVSEIRDEAFLAAVAQLRAEVTPRLEAVRETSCPPTPMMTAFRAAHGLLQAVDGERGTEIQLQDDDGRQIELPWTPRVVLMSIGDVPSRLEAERRSARAQRERSTSTRAAVARVREALGRRDLVNAGEAAAGIDPGAVPVLADPLRAARELVAQAHQACTNLAE